MLSLKVRFPSLITAGLARRPLRLFRPSTLTYPRRLSQYPRPVQVPASRDGLPPLSEWDAGVFNATLLDQNIVPQSIPVPHTPLDTPLRIPTEEPAISTGTIPGTARAITEVYSRVVDRFSSYYDIMNYEPSIPFPSTLDERLKLYTWSNTEDDHFPPHLAQIPSLAQAKEVDPQGARQDSFSSSEIFEASRLLNVRGLISGLIPQSFEDWCDGQPVTLADIEKRNAQLIHQYHLGSIYYKTENIGDKEGAPWYSDEVFAQQHLTGPNPVTIKQAGNWIEKFQSAAQGLGYRQVADHLAGLARTDRQSLYVQDYSDFRKAAGVEPDAALTQSDSKNGSRWNVASVCLFQLHDDGRLHPLGIVIDWHGSMDQSVVIFNKSIMPGRRTIEEEKNDWPWRYAKTCVQSSDWLRHEAGIHLTETHLVEEATIVAAHRAFEPNHAVYRLLQPHWLKTLSVNAAARAILVPDVIVPLSGLSLDQGKRFTQDTYRNFNWTQKYIPADLAARGFPPEDLDKPKFRNYAYARNMIYMWQAIRTFVQSFLKALSPDLENDEHVAQDQQIRSWCLEMQTRGSMSSFPTIQTFNELVDAVTMCIHIAAPQHTAVNYLQEYYQVFVINKPPSLYAAPPASLDELRQYDENKLMAALPINKGAHRQWLLAAHLPHLLNYTVAKDQNLVNCAKSWMHAAVPGVMDEQKVVEAATTFYNTLVQDLAPRFHAHSLSMRPGTIPYDVMDPSKTAVSVLI
ncbi:lipoxygenase [Kalaharituber pfeilii]|nr:lipoxygenase [Kalaharituber pfeilii]